MKKITAGYRQFAEQKNKIIAKVENQSYFTLKICASKVTLLKGA